MTQTLTERVTAKDRTDVSLAEEALKAADLQALHQMVIRLVGERRQLAQGFDALITGWSMLGGEKQQDTEAMFALERVATEAITFAREVVHALTQTKAGDQPKASITPGQGIGRKR